MIEKRSRSSIIMTVLAGVGLFAFATMASAQSSMKMALDWNFEGHHSPYLLAADSGIFAKHGLAVTVDRGFGSGDTATKVAAGAYDVGIADLGAVIAFNSKQGGNKLISIFQVYDVAPLAIMTLAANNIKTPADLRGKKLASPPGDAARVLFPVLAKANNVDHTSVEWVDVTPPLRPSLLVQKKVDAVTTLTSEMLVYPNLGLKDEDLVVMRYSDFGVKLYGHAIITTPEYANAHKKELTQFVSAIVEAWRATIKNPQPSIAVLKKRNELIDEKVESAKLALMLREAIGTEDVRKRGFSSVDPARLKYTVDMVTQSLAIPPIDSASLYRADFLPPQSELAYPQ